MLPNSTTRCNAHYDGGSTVEREAQTLSLAEVKPLIRGSDTQRETCQPSAEHSAPSLDHSSSDELS